MLVESEQVKYRIEKAQINADDAKEDGLAILYTIGAGSNLPIHILNQRSDQEVYASIRKADTPFSQFIRGKQEFFEDAFDVMYRKVIKSAVEAGVLPKRVRVPEYAQEALEEVLIKINHMVLEGADDKTIKDESEELLLPQITYRPVATEDVPISIEFPEVIREDMESQARVFAIHKEIGIVSQATLAAKAGYNWRQELSNKMSEISLFPGEEAAMKKKAEISKPDKSDKPAAPAKPDKPAAPKKKKKKEDKPISKSGADTGGGGSGQGGGPGPGGGGQGG